VSSKIFAILLLGVLVGCASSGGSGGSAGDGGFKPESRSSDPGLVARETTRGSAEAAQIELRTVYFDFDVYALRPDARRDLEENARTLRQTPDARIEIQGNCDERGSTEYNLALGQKRAESAKRYLIDLGVDASRIDTISFGEENPAVRGHNETAWAKNRRDDFVSR
jgi:peptidoglycan-associated lipoprotein